MTITIINLSSPIKEITKVTNWKEIPETAQKEILKGDHFRIMNAQSLLVYNGRQCVIDCMINRDYETGEIELLNGYNKEGKVF